MPAQSLRVMSYNIHQGIDDDCMARGAEVIRAAQADIIGIQEAWRNSEEPQKDNLGHLARRLEFHHAYLPVEFIEGFERGKPALNGKLEPHHKAFGEAILSRYPIQNVEGRILSFFPPPEEKWKQYRGAIRAEINVAGRVVQFFTCHLACNDLERRTQCREVMDFASKYNGPCIVTGDFNTQPEFDYYPELTRAGFIDAWNEQGKGPGYTMRPERPYKRIDYVLYVPGRGLTLNNIRVGDAGISDHMSLIADFQLD
jgi:endonuclease/exonuclease/phosphatase family metal-dependent hydrolase